MSDTPYIGFSGETLDKLPPVLVGDKIECVKCGGEHELLPPDNWKEGDEQPILLFYRCSGKSYIAAIAGKLIVNVKSDISGSM